VITTGRDRGTTSREQCCTVKRAPVTYSGAEHGTDPMVDQDRRRKYELRKRADSMAETRRRITEATVALHGSVGPARTTVAAIAERAGVQRHTVYRHFSTDEDLFAACAGHYWAEHPWPDPAEWEGIGDPRARVRLALGMLYAFYASVEPMMTNVLRDAEVLPIVERSVRSYVDYIDGIARRLGDGLAPGQHVVTVAVRHGIDFRTWHSLVRQGRLQPDEAVGLVVAMVVAAVDSL
jgi:AcrR family transcriptional regulator